MMKLVVLNLIQSNQAKLQSQLSVFAEKALPLGELWAKSLGLKPFPSMPNP